MKADNLRRGPWYEEEDERLKACIAILGERRWDSIARASGLRRSGKSCRLRWLNYLRPCLKQGPLTPEEERLVLQLHEKWGNKWANIARKLPGRTDNEIKNYYRTHLRKKIQMQNDMSCNSFPTDSFSSEETSSLSDQTNSSKHYQDTSSEEDKIIKEDVSIKQNNILLVHDELGTKSEPYTESHWTNGVSDYMTASSPYENRLSDWATRLSREQTDMFSNLSNWECNGLESSFDYSSAWSVGDSSLHDCTDTLWDVDLFNVKCE